MTLGQPALSLANQDSFFRVSASTNQLDQAQPESPAIVKETPNLLQPEPDQVPIEPTVSLNSPRFDEIINHELEAPLMIIN